jgi:crossover junction endodeoxyribonuclease RusA
MLQFVVEGRPVSQHASAKTRMLYKEKIRSIARFLNYNILTTSVRIIITHYYEGTFLGDLDNISKPICDALIGVVYVDDLQIYERTARRKNLHAVNFRIHDVSNELAQALLNRKEFVFVEVMVIEHG